MPGQEIQTRDNQEGEKLPIIFNRQEQLDQGGKIEHYKPIIPEKESKDLLSSLKDKFAGLIKKKDFCPIKTS